MREWKGVYWPDMGGSGRRASIGGKDKEHTLLLWRGGEAGEAREAEKTAAASCCRREVCKQRCIRRRAPARVAPAPKHRVQTINNSPALIWH